MVHSLRSFFESGDLLTLAVIALVSYLASSTVCEGLMAVQRIIACQSDAIIQQPMALTFACSWLFFLVFTIYLVRDAELTALFFLEQSLRSFLVSRIVSATLAVLFYLLFSIAEWIKAKRNQTPDFVVNLVGGLYHLRFLIPRIPKRTPRPSPQPLPEEVMQMRLEEARNEFEVRSASITDTPLEQVEVQTIRNQLKQEYLRKIRHILRGEHETTQ